MATIERVLAMGFFDGVHVGHAALLNKTIERASELGAVPSVLSFDVHPDNLVFNRPVPLINDARGREEIIRRCFGIDNVVFLHFTRGLMNMPWEEFAETIVAELNVVGFVVGYDFTFGRKGEGSGSGQPDRMAG
jgi:riboflavin kinase/FMN adenylyltransferase